MTTRRNLWLMVSLGLGTAFWLLGWVISPGPWHMAFKGSAVAALALFAFERSTVVTRPIAMVMVLGAIGDVLIEVDLNLGALTFLCGHCFACWIYIFNRRRLTWSDALVPALVLLAIPGLTSLILPGETGVLAYSCGLAAMVACAWCSRFPRDRVATGALLFAASDLLLFARMGVLSGNAVAGVAVWPLYYAGQVLIVVGVVYRPQLMITASSASRGSGRLATASGSMP